MTLVLPLDRGHECSKGRFSISSFFYPFQNVKNLENQQTQTLENIRRLSLEKCFEKVLVSHEEKSVIQNHQKDVDLNLFLTILQKINMHMSHSIDNFASIVTL